MNLKEAEKRVDLEGPFNGDGRSEAKELRGLLANLVEYASRPLEEAQALPGRFYTDAELYELEVERIFKREWIYVGRQDEIAEAGDWISCEIAGESVVVVRGGDGEVRALSRACAHRFADVLAEAEGDHGHTEAFVCPYHAWTYDLDGRMVSAPLMSRSTRFEREKGSYCLRKFSAEVWQGFVFVNLDPDATPLSPRFAELDELLAPYRLNEWRSVASIDWPETKSRANWKIAMDNGRECYHHLGAHRESVEPMWPSHLVDADTTSSKYFMWERLFVSPESAVGEEDGHLQQPLVFPSIDGLTPYQRSHYLLVSLFPSMWFAPGPDLLLTARWLPTGPASHKFDLGLSVHESQTDHPDADRIIAEAKEWTEQIQTEDSRIVLAIQRMLTSQSSTMQGGALSHLERPLWQFQKYLAHQLAGIDVDA